MEFIQGSWILLHRQLMVRTHIGTTTGHEQKRIMGGTCLGKQVVGRCQAHRCRVPAPGVSGPPSLGAYHQGILHLIS
jgi:hypothetical protein